MANLFKGYILSDGKSPLSKIKGGTYLTVPPENHDYVGVLYEDIVQLDFDDEATAQLALRIVKDQNLKCDILQTNRGIHLYFKNDGTISKPDVGIYNVIDIKCDIGCGLNNRTVPLRTSTDVPIIVNGEEVFGTTRKIAPRTWLQQLDEIDIMPCYFRPMLKEDQELRKSDTRNQTLFNYILKLQMKSFTRDEARQTINIINKYILYESLSQSEIDTITRDESFSEELFFDKDKFLHDRFGNYMLSNSNILNINSQIHIYTPDNLYSNDSAEFEKQMLKKIPSLKDNQRKEVYKYVVLQCSKKGNFAEARYLGMKNSILDIETLTEQSYTPNFVISNRINIEYNVNAYSKLMDDTLNKVCCYDPEIRALFEEMVGYTLYRANTMQSCFILTGEGSNGKSTILNCIKKLVGKQNYTSLDMRELDEQFKPAEMYNKLANIGDDISAKYMESSSVFKKVVTGESFMAQRKYGQPFQMECYATQIFCANELPQVQDRSDGFSRRIIIVPFNAKFTKDDPEYDPFIETKLLSEEAIAYLLNIGIQGLRRVLINKGFTKSNLGEREKSQYMKQNNNVLEWFDEDPNIEHQPVNDVYATYQCWCGTNGCRAVKKITLGGEISKKFGFKSKVKSIKGESVRVYEKGDSNDNTV
jgi:putative DNA primase/helicase